MSLDIQVASTGKRFDIDAWEACIDSTTDRDLEVVATILMLHGLPEMEYGAFENRLRRHWNSSATIGIAQGVIDSKQGDYGQWPAWEEATRPLLLDVAENMNTTGKDAVLAKHLTHEAQWMYEHEGR